MYAELGSTWRFLMRDPEQAAHGIGKLLKHVGPDNVLWGTDSIWYGSPQDQIQAFRTFQIAPEFREKHGGRLATMLLMRGAFHDGDPDRTTWTVVYTSPSAPSLWVVVDAADGSVRRTWRG